MAPSSSSRPAATLPRTLATFNGDNGEQPASDLISDTAGNLYGATSRGGDNGFAGTVFKVDAVTHELTNIAPVTPANGQPNGRLYRDAQGNLFGTSASGGFGTLFEITPGSDHLTTLVQFTGPNGRQPLGGLIADAAGNLYGTTHQGGSTFVPQVAVGFGTIFKYTPATNTFTTLASFTNDNGRLPLNDLVIDSHGNLFGTTDQGGEDSEGTIFELAAGSSTIVTLASFDDTSGGEPFAPLTVDAKGNLYGTTSSEGPGGLGAVFELPSGSNKLTTLASFTGDNGAFPSSSILIDHDGNLLGTTSQGGPDDAGTIFKLTRVNVPGDYDDNGIVNSADYDLWRRHLRLNHQSRRRRQRQRHRRRRRLHHLARRFHAWCSRNIPRRPIHPRAIDRAPTHHCHHPADKDGPPLAITLYLAPGQ